MSLLWLTACGRAREPAAPKWPKCIGCHGGTDNQTGAPPIDLAAKEVTTSRGVGAHSAHVQDGPLARAYACGTCHPDPRQEASAHRNGRVDLVFGALATGNGALQPAFDRSGSLACSSVYCHGATLPGGAHTAPVWTRVGAGEAACGTCHGAPPPAPHPGLPNCGNCHAGYTSTTVNLDTHVNGAVEVGDLTCTSCHGDPSRPPTVRNPQLGAAPPLGTRGETSTSERAVGAHGRHLAGDGVEIACSECHVVPTSTRHSTGTVAVVFGPLARTGGATPAWDGTGCASSYCHGGFAGGNPGYVPVWTRPASSPCGTCHGNPAATPSALPRAAHVPLAPGSTNATCAACHPDTVDASGNVIAGGGKHLDGAVDTDPAAKHPAGWTDPQSPDFHGASAIRDVLRCSRCHAPSPPAQVTTVVCATCHDALAGGVDWTTVCNTCHGSAANAAPPEDTTGNTSTTALGVGAHQSHVTAAHALSPAFDCFFCHAKPANVYDPGHLDGQVSVSGYTGLDPTWQAAVKDPGWSASAATCTTSYCHGAFRGGNATNAPVWTMVGQGQADCGTCHGIPPSATHLGVGGSLTGCPSCHPETVSGTGQLIPPGSGGKHLNGSVDVAKHGSDWMDPSSAGFHAYAADSSLAPCQACHGAALDGVGAIVTTVSCSQCHVAGWSTNCVMCHGGTNDLTGAPPRTTWGNGGDPVRVGAHGSHVAGSTIAAPFDCGVCHVKPADAFAPNHIDGPTATVTFGGLASTGGTTPTWDRASATCSSTYCHGATLPDGTNHAPLWTKVDGTQAACGTCHGNPPGSGRHAMHVTSFGIPCWACHPGKWNVVVDVASHVSGVKDMNPAGSSYGTFADWSATAAGDGTLRGTATGCHGGIYYWTGSPPAPRTGCQ